MGEMIFEVGATVRLKSGGPLMVINEVKGVAPDRFGVGVWGCVWIESGVLMGGDFDERTLLREEPKEVA